MRFRAKYPAILLLVLAAMAVLGWVVMLLWNLVVPAAFAGAHAIDYPHALGLLILCRILFGGFRGRRGDGRGRYLKKWAALTAEEREQLLKQRSSHC
jgi:hypothetical protein